MKKIIIFGFIIIFVSTVELVFSQTSEQIPKTQEEIEKEKLLREKIEKEKPKPEVEEKVITPLTTPTLGEQKVFIKTITITGATLLSEKELKKIISSYENQELTLSQMQKVAGLITEAYRKKGFITSRAYLPPQKIEGGILEIRVLEGITGDIEVKGNRYFKSNLYRKKIALKKNQPFNYEELRKGLARINELADRSAKAVITPGKEPGTTDVVLEVKDYLPVHFGFEFDNFGSRYIEKDRYTFSFTHNNLLGFDDKLSFQYQLAQHNRYFLKNIRYLLPLDCDWELGLFASFSRVKLGKEYEDQDSRGKSRTYGLFLNKILVEQENISLNLNFGFDYKDATNYLNEALSSKDRLRILKAGFDLDITDNFGRSIISAQIDSGIPNIMGGLGEPDPKASRSGSGGKFIKETLNIIRLQNIPFNAKLLWKNQIQISPYILPSLEQFQIGGISNNRGYPPAEVVGDEGYSMIWELSMPIYFIPRDFKVPLSKAKLFEATRLVIFYDWATAHLHRPSLSEEKTKTLRSFGVGARFNLPENFSLRLEVGWPVDNSPSDSDHAHTWIGVSKEF